MNSCSMCFCTCKTNLPMENEKMSDNVKLMFPKHLPIYEVTVNGCTAEWDTDKKKCDRVYGDAVGSVKMFKMDQSTGIKSVVAEKNV